jgi:hypothetical protein
MICKESLGRLSLLLLMVIIRNMKMHKYGYWELGKISNCTTIHEITSKSFRLRGFGEVMGCRVEEVRGPKSEVPEVDLHHRSKKKRSTVASSQVKKVKQSGEGRNPPKLQSLELIRTVCQEGCVSADWFLGILMFGRMSVCGGDNSRSLKF